MIKKQHLWSCSINQNLDLVQMKASKHPDQLCCCTSSFFSNSPNKLTPWLVLSAQLEQRWRHERFSMRKVKPGQQFAPVNKHVMFGIICHIRAALQTKLRSSSVTVLHTQSASSPWSSASTSDQSHGVTARMDTFSLQRSTSASCNKAQEDTATLHHWCHCIIDCINHSLSHSLTHSWGLQTRVDHSSAHVG